MTPPGTSIHGPPVGNHWLKTECVRDKTIVVFSSLEKPWDEYEYL